MHCETHKYTYRKLDIPIPTSIINDAPSHRPNHLNNFSSNFVYAEAINSAIKLSSPHQNGVFAAINNKLQHFRLATGRFHRPTINFVARTRSLNREEKKEGRFDEGAKNIEVGIRRQRIFRWIFTAAPHAPSPHPRASVWIMGYETESGWILEKRDYSG